MAENVTKKLQNNLINYIDTNKTVIAPVFGYWDNSNLKAFPCISIKVDRPIYYENLPTVFSSKVYFSCVTYTQDDESQFDLENIHNDIQNLLEDMSEVLPIELGIDAIVMEEVQEEYNDDYQVLTTITTIYYQG